MKKYLAYSVGSTGARTLFQLKQMLGERDAASFIFRAFDMDSSIQDVGLDTESEIFIAAEENFRETLGSIVNGKRSQPALFERVNRIVPLTDPSYVRTRPATQGAGACKDPSVSSVAGYLNRTEIQKEVDGDTNRVGMNTDSGGRHAFLILSPCGGTSTGLHLPVLEKLLQKGFSVYLFLLSPSFFLRVQSDVEGILKANTVATIMRIAFDKREGKMRYMEGTPDTGRLYPFFLESDWEDARYAELNPETGFADPEKFVAYAARVVLGFIRNITSVGGTSFKQQSWLSSYINDEMAISENEEYFNTIQMYPRLGALAKGLNLLRTKMQERNGQTAEENLLTLLRTVQVNNAQSAIIGRPELVEQVMDNAIRNQTLPAGEIRAIFDYVKSVILRNK